MPFEGFQPEKKSVPAHEQRRLDAIAQAEDAELIEDEPVAAEDGETIPEDGNLNLEKISHLETFLESAEDVFADASQFKAQALAENYKTLNAISFDEDSETVRGADVFSTLYEKLQEFQQTVDTVRYDTAPETGYTDADTVPITFEDVSKLQELYDEMILLRNHVFSAYKKEGSAASAEVSEPIEDTKPSSQPAAPAWEYTLDKSEYSEETPVSELEQYRATVAEELRSFLAEHGAKRIDGRLAKSIAQAQTQEEIDRIKHNILHNPEFSSSDTEAMPSNEQHEIASLKQQIAEEYVSVKENRDLLSARFPKATRTEDVENTLEILTAFVKRAQIISERAAILDDQDSSVMINTLEKYRKNIEHVSKESELFIEGLTNAEARMSELDEVSPASETEQSDVTKEQEVVESVPEEVEAEQLPEPEPEPEPVVELVQPEPVVESDAEQSKADTETAEQVQSREKRVRKALDAAYQNLFLSPTEKETVKAFHREIKHQIESGASAEKINLTVESLEHLVSDFTQHPAVDYIPDRMKKVLSHVNAASGMHAEMKETVKAMSEVVTRLMEAQNAGENIADSRIVQAYQNLESFANDNESDWLTVCGMGIPKAGPDGVFGARSLREGLMVARDSHPELRRSLSKQLFLDDIVRMLQVVPNSGLTQEQVDKIARLAREIDVPLRVVEARQAEKEPKTSETEVASGKESAQPVKAEVPVKETTSVHVETAKDRIAEFKKRANIPVSSEDADVPVEIEVSRGAETIIAEEEEGEEEIESTEPSDERPGIFHPALSSKEQLVRSQAEETDVVDQLVPDSVPNISSREKVNYESLTRKYLISSEYSEFIAEHYSSPEAFEKTLQIEIQNIDSKGEDKMAQYFGEKSASAFGLLQDMKIEKFKEFLSKSHDEKSGLLRMQNVRYEAVSVWADLLRPMIDVVGENPDMSFGELFARWMIETEMTYFEQGTNASQFTL